MPISPDSGNTIPISGLSRSRPPRQKPCSIPASSMNDLPSHPDMRVVAHEIAFKRHLRLDFVRFHHRLFSGEWSGERAYDVVRRGAAVAVLLYDPGRDAIVLVEQFRLPPLLAGYSPWVVEVVAGLVAQEGGSDAEGG